MVYSSFHRIRESLLQHLPVLSPIQRNVARSLYLLLFQGRPVPISQVAESLDHPTSQVETVVSSLGELERNPDGAVTAFRGLTLQPTKHEITRIGSPEVVLHTWCAFDALFLADLLDEPVRIRSFCPQSGASLSLDIHVSPTNWLSNDELQVSFPRVDACDYQNDLRSSFCCHVQFYRDEAAVKAWRAEHDENLDFLSIQEALDLARERNREFLGKQTEPFTRPMDQLKVAKSDSIP